MNRTSNGFGNQHPATPEEIKERADRVTRAWMRSLLEQWIKSGRVDPKDTIEQVLEKLR